MDPHCNNFAENWEDSDSRGTVEDFGDCPRRRNLVRRTVQWEGEAVLRVVVVVVVVEDTAGVAVGASRSNVGPGRDLDNTANAASALDILAVVAAADVVVAEDALHTYWPHSDFRRGDAAGHPPHRRLQIQEILAVLEYSALLHPHCQCDHCHPAARRRVDTAGGPPAAVAVSVLVVVSRRKILHLLSVGRRPKLFERQPVGER